MAKVIRCKLDPDSIEKAIKELSDYRYELLKKVDLLMDALLQDGLIESTNRLASTIGEEVETIEDVYEPYLMQKGFIGRTPRGRIVLPKAYEHLGMKFGE